MTDRLARARAEIARRRALAEQATPGPWTYRPQDGDGVADILAERVPGGILLDADEDYGAPQCLAHIAANDPTHVLAVLAAADATLDRHARTHLCQARWLNDDEAADPDERGHYLWPPLVCADAKSVLDLYAVEPQ